VLERSSGVELQPSLQAMYEATRKVCEDLMAVTEDLPRLALQATPRQLRELEVGVLRVRPPVFACGRVPAAWRTPENNDAALARSPTFFFRRVLSCYCACVMSPCRCAVAVSAGARPAPAGGT
jgi:hypothetical protein